MSRSAAPRLRGILGDHLPYSSVSYITQWKAYGDAYRTAQTDWKDNGGPSEDSCQYYPGSHMPIVPRPGLVWWQGVGNK